MSLSDKQARFADMTALLIPYARLQGYRVRYGEAYRLPGSTHGHRKSLHYDRLAVDFILDKRDATGRWRYQRSTSAYRVIGEFWEFIGGTWGGRFNDGNHFSVAHRGMK